MPGKVRSPTRYRGDPARSAEQLEHRARTGLSAADVDSMLGVATRVSPGRRPVCHAARQLDEARQSCSQNNSRFWAAPVWNVKVMWSIDALVLGLGFARSRAPSCRKRPVGRERLVNHQEALRTPVALSAHGSLGRGQLSVSHWRPCRGRPAPHQVLLRSWRRSGRNAGDVGASSPVVFRVQPLFWRVVANLRAGSRARTRIPRLR